MQKYRNYGKFIGGVPCVKCYPADNSSCIVLKLEDLCEKAFEPIVVDEFEFEDVFEECLND